jgi:hypothetical protein
VFTKYGPQARAVLEALLAKYQDEGVLGLTGPVQMLEDPALQRMGTPLQLIKQFGGPRLRAAVTNCNPRFTRKPPSPCPSKSIQDIMRQDTGVDGDAQRISQLCWMFFLKIIDDQDQELELMQRLLPLADPGAPFQWRTWAADPEGITGDELLAFINGELFPR